MSDSLKKEHSKQLKKKVHKTGYYQQIPKRKKGFFSFLLKTGLRQKYFFSKFRFSNVLLSYCLFHGRLHFSTTIMLLSASSVLVAVIVASGEPNYRCRCWRNSSESSILISQLQGYLIHIRSFQLPGKLLGHISQNQTVWVPRGFHVTK